MAKITKNEFFLKLFLHYFCICVTHAYKDFKVASLKNAFQWWYESIFYLFFFSFIFFFWLTEFCCFFLFLHSSTLSSIVNHSIFLICNRFVVFRFIWFLKLFVGLQVFFFGYRVLPSFTEFLPALWSWWIHAVDGSSVPPPPFRFRISLRNVPTWEMMRTH